MTTTASVRILLLPGMDGTGRLFVPILDCLPGGVEARVVEYPVDQKLGLDGLLSVVESQFAAGTPHVVLAESYSGPIGIRYALRRPDDVKALILCASFIRNPLPLPLRWLPRLAFPTLGAPSPPGSAIRALLVGSRAPASAIEEVSAAIEAVSLSVLAHRIRSLASLDVRREMSLIEQPVLYLQGTADRLVGSRGAQQIRRALPTAEIRPVEGPHLLLQTRPRKSMDAVLEFIHRHGCNHAVV